jgi:hypothetical protein
MAPKSFFRKTRFRSLFTKPPPSPIFQTKRTMWRISRQNYHRRKLRSLLPKTAPKSFFLKNAFPICFYETAPLTYFRGQKVYVARFEAKLSRTKTLLAFPSRAPIMCHAPWWRAMRATPPIKRATPPQVPGAIFLGSRPF